MHRCSDFHVNGTLQIFYDDDDDVKTFEHNKCIQPTLASHVTHSPTIPCEKIVI